MKLFAALLLTVALVAALAAAAEPKKAFVPAGDQPPTYMKGALPTDVLLLNAEDDDLPEMEDIDYHYVHYDAKRKSYTLQKGLDKGSNDTLAWGWFDAGAEWTGLGRLWVSTSWRNTHGDAEKMHAAGYLEGALTADQLWAFHSNVKAWRAGLVSAGTREAVGEFLLKSMYWAQETAAKVDPERSARQKTYWAQVTHFIEFVKGMLAGYNDHAKSGQTLQLADLLLLNAEADMDNLLSFHDVNYRTAWDAIMLDEGDDALRNEYARKLGGTAFLKLIGRGGDDFVLGHSTAGSYAKLHNIYKQYNFVLASNARANRVAVASHPGVVSSPGGFYVTDARLVVLGTAMPVLREDYFTRHKVLRETLPTWLRAMVACVHESSAYAFLQTFKEHAGAYSTSQYLVVDDKKFRPSKALRSNFAWFGETVGAATDTRDLSSKIGADKMVALAGVPITSSAASRLGYNDFLGRFAAENSARLATLKHELANIGEATYVDAAKAVLENTHASGGDGAHASAAVAPRLDTEELEDESDAAAMAYGALDAKLMVHGWVSGMFTHVRSGPPASHGKQAFSYAGAFAALPHDGQADKQAFGWQLSRPDSRMDSQFIFLQDE